ncbi:MAG: hypothetical protein IKE43_07540 [Coriobacteriales bacterium]|nr:hypothetical protein [Coriobacteriales bacterium]
MLHDMIMVPAQKNKAYGYDIDLFRSSQQKMRESGSIGMQIAIHPGTEYEMHVPYSPPAGKQILINDKYYPISYCEPIKDTYFELRLSNSPICHLVDINLA